MPEPITIMYKCPDGSDFPVTWDDPGDANLVWQSFRHHDPWLSTPLEVETHRYWAAEVKRALDEVGFFVPMQWRHTTFPNGWRYGGPSMTLLAEEVPLHAAAIARLVRRFGGVSEIWEERCAPIVQQLLARLRTTNGQAEVSRLVDWTGYVLGQTFIAGQSVRGEMVQLVRFCQEEFGEDGEMFAMELTQGFENATTDFDQAVWPLAQTARETGVLPSGQARTMSITDLERSGDFYAAFQAFLAGYGETSQVWQLASPTWFQRPNALLEMVAAVLESDSISPLEALAAARKRRENLLADLLGRLDSKPERASQLRDLAHSLVDYVAIREGRARLQLTCYGVTRLAIVRVGQHLVEQRRLENAADVFYALQSEIESDEDLRQVVEQRKAEAEAWAYREVPAFIGVDPTEATATPSSSVLKGIAASRGQFTGKARVQTEPDGARLRPGEILVCATTSPAWTPLFQVAGAVLTETGGILTHAAITAREFGIPCVAGVRSLLSRVRDGMLLRVDGLAGTVEILDDLTRG